MTFVEVVETILAKAQEERSFEQESRCPNCNTTLVEGRFDQPKCPQPRDMCSVISVYQTDYELSLDLERR